MAASQPAWSTGWSSGSQEPQGVQTVPDAASERPAIQLEAGGKPVILVFNKWDLLSQLAFQVSRTAPMT